MGRVTDKLKSRGEGSMKQAPSVTERASRAVFGGKG